ncbi:uncharacterized protein BX663DRAFT_440625 [Cokeromyces recurvatus]|uniref:uncharacterized protein n=1 Tax=Cokeromyces recurvatus TaxID=90255 RepID=UPI002220C3B5|nr:uncharacterized protein BX663DRAFT_440625 [Cokeromyces recurvatus]KAI7899686.1 hypothetical protein BX663DRAFT_440625 [Cokeromyces recurvatus]
MNQSHQQTTRPRQLSNSSEKVYSFVAIPGTNQKKRPRRRYDEIERLYHCNWPGCSKAYGTLNHLNAHVSMQKHGPKRHPSEFKEMRKEWRRQKKAREAASKKRNNIDNNTVISQQQINGNDSMYRPNATTFQPQYTQIPTNTMSLNEFY